MSEKIMKKLGEHDELFKNIDARFEQVDRRFERVEEQLDLIAHTVVKHTEDIAWLKENMATKDDIRGLANTLDVLVKLNQKNDQEITFMGNRVKRVETQTEQNTKDIKIMKPMLGIS